MTKFVITTSPKSAACWNGEDKFVRDVEKAKTYATAAAAKRGLPSAEAKTGKTGLAVRSTDELAAKKAA